MSVEFDDLLTPVSREEAIEEILANLELLGFNSRSWQTGSIQLMLVTIVAWMQSAMSKNVPTTAGMRFNETAAGKALTFVAKNDFDNDRYTATYTKGVLNLTDASGDGPHTVQAGELVWYDTVLRRRFRNITGGTIPLSGTVQLQILAEEAGTASNVAPGTITGWVTPIAGVTATNPVDWILVSARDEELDPQLKIRNSTKWATLTGTPPAKAYYNWALNAQDINGDPVPITRVAVDAQNPNGPGTLAIYVATASGTATAQEVSDVQDWIDALKSVTANPTVYAPTPLPQTFTGTIWMEANYSETVLRPAVDAAIAAYVNAIPIGGVDLGSGGIMQDEKLIAAVMNVPGVAGFDLATPSGDPAVGQFEIVTIQSTVGLSYIPLPEQS